MKLEVTYEEIEMMMLSIDSNQDGKINI